MISFSFDDYIDHITVIIQDGKNNYPYSDSFTVGKNSGDYSVQVTSRELTAGEYYLEIYTSPVDGWIGRTLAYQKEITVSGKRKASPILTADKEEIRYEESVRFTVSAPGYERAYVYGYENEDYTFWSAFVELDENGYGETVHRTSYDGNATLQFKAAAYDGEAWTEWTSPLSIRVIERPELSMPVIHAPSTITAGENLIFSFDEVENATEYWTDLWAANNDDSILSYYPASPTDLIEVPGYRMEAGDYTLGVRVSAEGYNSNEKQQHLTVTGRKPNGPEATVEEPLHVGQNAVFTVNTQNAEALQVRYQIASDTRKGDTYYVSVPITGDSTQWSYRIYKNFMGIESKRLSVAFSTKQNGIWSAWKGKTYNLEEPLPLEPAVIHVDDVIEPQTDFSIIIDPVENAIRYDCYITHEDGWLIHGINHFVSIGELKYNSGDMRPGVYLIRVIAYSSDFDGNPSSTSEKTFTIKGLPPLDPVAIHVDDMIEAGKDFRLSVDPVPNATRYEYGLYQAGQSIRHYNKDSSIGELNYGGYELDPGQYSFKVWAYSDGYTESISEKTFTITGTKSPGPTVTVDNTDVYTNEYYTFTIDTAGADALVVKYKYSTGEGINIQGETTKWSHYAYDFSPGIWPYQFAVLKNGRWSAWSDSIEINARNKPNLEQPAVIVSDSINSGNDLTFSFRPVDNATSYSAYFASAYGGNTLFSWESGTIFPDTELTIPGYLISSGNYAIKVTAYANGYNETTKTTYVTSNGQRPTGPSVLVEEPIRIKSKAEFFVDTEGAEALQVKYQYTAPNNWWSEEQISVPVTGDITTWEHTIDEYYQGVNLTVSFAAKVDGVWSAWRTKTYTIEGLPPLDPAVIRVNETVEAGCEFSVAVDPVENATNYRYALYKPDGNSYTSYTTSYIGSNTYSGYTFEPGEYMVKVWAYSDDYATSMNQKTFTITGPKAPAPTVSVDKTEFYSNEARPVITITAQGAEAIRCNDGTVLVVGEDGIATYSPYMYIYSEDEREYSFSFCAVVNDVWTAWSEPITMKIKRVQEPDPEPLDEPVIHLPETFLAGRDFTFSFDAVDGATSYEAYITRYYTDSSVYSNYSVTPGTDLTVTGRSLTAGRYVVKVYAKATGRATSSSQVEFRVTGERGETPVVTTDKDDYNAGDTITFSIETEGIEEIHVEFDGSNGDVGTSGSRTITAEGNSTVWSYSIPSYYYGTRFDFSFYAKREGTWSKPKTITVAIPSSSEQ